MILPQIGWDRVTVHPSALLDGETLEVVRLWQLWRPSGFAGYGPLPYSGGPAEQPVVLLDALMHCSRVAALARPPERRAEKTEADRG